MTDEGRRFQSELVATAPHLKKLARALSNDACYVDDLVQETLLKAWQARRSFQAGTNLRAWTSVILRNQFYSDARRAWRWLPWSSQTDQTLAANVNLHSPLDLEDALRAMQRLPLEQRAALWLVGACGLTYQDASATLGCTSKAAKTRVSRARHHLADLLSRTPSPLAASSAAPTVAAGDLPPAERRNGQFSRH